MALPVPQLALADFLAWEIEQPDRHEYYHGETFAMVGARRVHGLIGLNLAAALKSHLKGSPCRAFVESMKVQVADDAMFYPDVFVTCDARDRSPEADLVKQHPALIVEVLSESTAAYDRGRKFELYRRLPELQEVPFVDPDRMQVDLLRRNQQGRWELYPVGVGETLELASLALTVSLAEVYADVLPVQAERTDGKRQDLTP